MNTICNAQVEDQLWLAFRDEGRSLHSFMYAPVRMDQAPTAGRNGLQDEEQGNEAAQEDGRPQMVIQSQWYVSPSVVWPGRLYSPVVKHAGQPCLVQLSLQFQCLSSHPIRGQDMPCSFCMSLLELEVLIAYCYPSSG